MYFSHSILTSTFELLDQFRPFLSYLTDDVLVLCPLESELWKKLGGHDKLQPITSNTFK